MLPSDYMQEALGLAARGAGRVSPNPMVGAVVVKDGIIVGRGWHKQAGGPHAEVHALDEAGAQARGAELYVTLEPCNHFGRTPPCTRKIIAAGVRKVVAAMCDPNPDVAGGGNAALSAAGIEVECGLCRAEAERLNEAWIKFVRTRRPFVVLKLAATLDGRIAARSGDSRWVTGPQARARVHELRHRLDAILVGIGTVLADDPQLTARLSGGRGKDPIRLVLDTNLRMPDQARMLHQESEAPTILICPARAAQEHAGRKERLAAAGARILEAPEGPEGIDLPALTGMLGGMDITSVLIEGGSRVAGAALRAGIVDKIVFFYAPKILGGDDGLPMLGGPGPELMSACRGLRDVSVGRVGEDIMVEGYLEGRSI